jgi:hypothetical protein
MTFAQLVQASDQLSAVSGQLQHFFACAVALLLHDAARPRLLARLRPARAMHRSLLQMKRSLFIALTLLSALAFAHPGATLSQRALLEVQQGDRGISARASPSGINGQNVMLRWTPGGLTGRWLDQEVGLRSRGDSIDGAIGSMPVLVSLSRVVVREGSALGIHGTLGDDHVEVWVSPLRIRGMVGACTYSLSLAGDVYRGWADCAPATVPEKSVLELPRVPGHEDDMSTAQLVMIALARLEPSEAVGRAAPLDDIVSQRFGLVVEDVSGRVGNLRGARVMRVFPGSPAAAAGLAPGMIITRAGDEPVGRARTLEAALARLQPGQSLLLRSQWVDRPEWAVSPIVAPPLRR